MPRVVVPHQIRSLCVVAASVLSLTVLAVACVTNRPPVAVAPDDRSVEVGVSVALSGAGSSDPDGDALTFAWRLDGVPAASVAALSETEGPLTGFTPDVAGIYTVVLAVSDGSLTATDRVRVTANDGAIDTVSVLPIDDRTTRADESIVVPIEVVADDLDAVTVVGSSSDTALVADGAIESLGTGATRSLRITPTPRALGTAVITATARTPSGVEAAASFALEIRRPFAQTVGLEAHDADDGDSFGVSVAIDGAFAVVGAPNGGPDTGSAYVYVRSGDTWVLSLQLPPAGPVVAADVRIAASAGDRFGSAVALHGGHAVIGAPGDDDARADAGAAYVYERCPPFDACTQPWREMAKLTANDAAQGDDFGVSVAISGDHAIVGASFDDAATGSAYLFRRSGDSWFQFDKLTADDAASGDLFGTSVAVSGDHAIVGAPGAGASGAAYVFRRNGASWDQVVELIADDVAPASRFGASVAISSAHAIVGAPDDDAGGTLGFAGSAYVFRRNGDAWDRIDELVARDAAGFDGFGSSVAISGDDAMVGAPGGGDEANAGSAYVFRRIGDAWTEVDELTASDAAQDDFFGTSVAIGGDFAISGAPTDGAPGSIYLFSR